MKTSLTLALLALSLTLVATNARALPLETCLEYAAEANTDWASRLILGHCRRNESRFFKSKAFACAIKAGKAKTEYIAKATFGRCFYD